MEIQCKGNADENFSKLRLRLDDYKKRGKLEQVEEVQYNDAQKTVYAKGTGFTCTIACKDQKLDVQLDLNFFLKPMRGKIEDMLKSKLSEAVV